MGGFTFLALPVLVAVMFGSTAHAADGATPVTFEVRFALTDRENQPISAEPVRLVLGDGRDWQKRGEGEQFSTGSDGKYMLQLEAPLHPGSRKRPTNFIDSLSSGKEATIDLQVAAELPYAGHRWLYVVQLHRFKSDGTVLLGEVAVFCPDEQGNFTRASRRTKDGGWLIPDLDGLTLTTSGHDLANFLFHPDENDSTGQRWILNIQFKRAPEPVRR